MKIETTVLFCIILNLSVLESRKSDVQNLDISIRNKCIIELFLKKVELFVRNESNDNVIDQAKRFSDSLLLSSFDGGNCPSGFVKFAKQCLKED